MSCTVQLYYSYRIYILSKSRALVFAICLVSVSPQRNMDRLSSPQLSLTQCISGIVASVQDKKVRKYSELAEKLRFSTPVSLLIIIPVVSLIDMPYRLDLACKYGDV